MIDTLIVLAKRPVPGRVKTRLVPPLTHGQAAGLAAAALTDTLDAVTDAAAARRILAFDGDSRSWLRPGWVHVQQPHGGLDARLVGAFDAAGSAPALLVGMDTPQLTRDRLASFDWAHHDACVGPAPDGGYWAIGFRTARLAAAAITGVAMSTSHTCTDQLQRLAALGLRVQVLDELRDVDTVEDARAVAALAPGTAFGAAFARIEPAAA